MTAMRILSPPDREQAAQIVALLSALIHAWATNDFDEAAQARDELRTLGVKVQLPRRLPGKQGASR